MAHQKMEKSFLMKGSFFLYSTYVYVSTFWLPVFFFFLRFIHVVVYIRNVFLFTAE